VDIDGASRAQSLQGTLEATLGGTKVLLGEWWHTEHHDGLQRPQCVHEGAPHGGEMNRAGPEGGRAGRPPRAPKILAPHLNSMSNASPVSVSPLAIPSCINSCRGVEPVGLIEGIISRTPARRAGVRLGQCRWSCLEGASALLRRHSSTCWWWQRHRMY
jgi:hypothetical protein